MNHTIFMADIKGVISVVDLRIIEIPQKSSRYYRIQTYRCTFCYFQRPSKKHIFDCHLSTEVVFLVWFGLFFFYHLHAFLQSVTRHMMRKRNLCFTKKLSAQGHVKKKLYLCHHKLGKITLASKLEENGQKKVMKIGQEEKLKKLNWTFQVA